MSSEVTVGQIMHPVITIDPNAKVQEAARIMTEKDIGSVVATKNGKTTGIVTQRDLVEKIVARAVDPSRITVSEIMTAPAATIESSASLVDAARRMMERKVKRLLVKEGDRIIGIVSQTDLVRTLADLQSLTKLGIV